MSRVFAAINKAPWAIMPAALQTIREVAARMTVDADVVEAWKHPSRAAIQSRDGQPLQGARYASLRGNVAVLPITGPIFPRANMMTEMSGAQSLQCFLRDLTLCVENEDVTAILLDVDSPGGVAFGINEAAGLIRQATEVKPVVAYVGGMGCSAAYWLASAASEVVVEETALVGSIGVVCGVSVQETPDLNGEIHKEIVSTHAPAKRPDFKTDEGIATERAILDKLETTFIDTVARFRGVTRNDVLADFGQGGVKVGVEAVSSRMADRVGTFEQVLADLLGAASTQPGGRVFTQEEEFSMSDKETAPAAEEKKPVVTVESLSADHPQVADHFRAEGREAGRKEAVERISSILTHGEAEGREATAQHLAFNTLMDVEAAAGLLATMPKQAGHNAASAVLTALAEDEHGQAHVDSVAETSDSLTVDAPLEDRAKAAWDKDADLRAEFGSLSSYISFLKVEEDNTARRA